MLLYEDISAEYGFIYAIDLFYKFKDISNFRGENFNWCEFPNIAGKIAVANLFTQFNKDAAYSKRLEDICYYSAVAEAKELIEKYKNELC